MPSRTHFPSPIFQEICLLITGNNFLKLLQKKEPVLDLHFLSLIQDSTLMPLSYLLCNTTLHNVSPKSPLQKLLIHNVVLNQPRSLIPQPPIFLGKEMDSHELRCILLFALLAEHIKFIMTDLILCSVATGILLKENQYIGILVNTKFTSISLPPSDNHLKHQHLILPSTFLINHLQSLIEYMFGLTQ